MVRVLSLRGSERALVFHGSDGLDELTLSGPSVVWRLDRGEVSRTDVSPIEVGLQPASVAELLGGTAEVNAGITRRVLDGEPGPHRDVSMLNAAAAIAASGRTNDLAEAVAIAAESIDSGTAGDVLDRVVARSLELAGG